VSHVKERGGKKDLARRGRAEPGKTTEQTVRRIGEPAGAADPGILRGGCCEERRQGGVVETRGTNPVTGSNAKRGGPLWAQPPGQNLGGGGEGAQREGCRTGGLSTYPCVARRKRTVSPNQADKCMASGKVAALGPPHCKRLKTLSLAEAKVYARATPSGNARFMPKM